MNFYQRNGERYLDFWKTGFWMNEWRDGRTKSVKRHVVSVKRCGSHGENRGGGAKNIVYGPNPEKTEVKRKNTKSQRENGRRAPPLPPLSLAFTPPTHARAHKHAYTHTHHHQTPRLTHIPTPFSLFLCGKTARRRDSQGRT